jgi:hypothetical protein
MKIDTNPARTLIALGSARRQTKGGFGHKLESDGLRPYM